MRAKNLMNTNPPWIHADATLAELVRTVNQKKLDGICVVEDDRRLVGVVSLFELFQALVPDYVRMREELAHLVHEGYFEEVCARIKDRAVRTVMRTDVVAFQEEDTLISVVAETVRYRLMVLPVVRNGVLVGTIHKKGLFEYAGKLLIQNAPGS